MIITAIDSTAKTASVAVWQDGKALGCVSLHSGYTHSESLLPCVQFLYKSLHLTVADTDIFACAAGPGSFTGVRIGVATVKGLAFDSGKPCCAVSTLEALAQGASETHGIVCSVMDARRGQLYTALFDCADGIPKRLTEDDAMSTDELCNMLSSYIDANRPVYFAGDGYDIAYDAISPKLTFISPTPRSMREHSAIAVSECAARDAEAGRLTTDIALSPSYLRPSQAEREYNEKHGIIK